MWSSIGIFVLVIAVTKDIVNGSGNLVRKNVDDLTATEILDLQIALDKLEADDGDNGYQTIAGYHGAPAQCTDEAGKAQACCVHGMPTFPQWHRLFMVQMERALEMKGSSIGIPFWDWTQPLKSLPGLVEDPIFIDPQGGKAKLNVWHGGAVKHANTHTARAVDKRLFEKVAAGKNTRLFDTVLDALEEDDYCDFEPQFEIAHNTIHYLTGGRYKYSMSSLEYTSYDPIFFLHHSNVDRLLVIWQELQKLRNKPSDHANCAINLFNSNLQPFNWDSNPLALTKENAVAKNTFDYSKFGYSYSDLHLNGMNLPELKALLDDRRRAERFSASFRLHGLGMSANIGVYVCKPAEDGRSSDHCKFAGDFFALGGPTEMPWKFRRPYKFDVTKTVISFEVPQNNGRFYVKASLSSVNGTSVDSSLLPKPTLIHRPSFGHRDPTPRRADATKVVVRKNINRLTSKETYELRRALGRLQEDKSVDGYQAIAEYHGLPAKCPSPDAKNRLACCIHGMPTFPHWHRLFMTQIEDALVRRGSPIGVPYWDWARPQKSIPTLAAESMYTDPTDGTSKPNPFYNASVAFESGTTSRKPDSRLFEAPKFGDHTYLFDGMLLAFEQEDFCDFEVQFEIIHNAIHTWVGGSEKYAMSTLHYTAFDPIFYLHHSNVDRLWGIWQALQIKRGKPYKAHCARSYVSQPLKPFAFDSPLNNNEKTKKNAIPTNIYDYENVLGYTYDSLEFGGMSVDQLDHYIQTQQRTDRTFAGFILAGFKTSANVEVFIKKQGADAYKVGTFAVLGGSKEMEWAFDREYWMDITDGLQELGLDHNDDFEIQHKITDVSGAPLNASLLLKASVMYKPALVDATEDHDHTIIRKNVNSLTREEVYSIRKALAALKEDKSPSGFEQIGAFHGEPDWCPRPEAENKFSCCVHGMATFPHWHRLHTVQFENGLRSKGYKGALPYWDWTIPITALPTLASAETYVDPNSGETVPNPWKKAHIGRVNVDTTRDVNNKLFYQPKFGKYTVVAQQILLALEQDDFCSFEVHYEIAHNLIHALVGGSGEYSMASLRYTGFDPIFYLHHANVDRIWAIWQALQKYRGKAYNSANCALTELRKPLQPFGLDSSINPDIKTRDHAVPLSTFNYKSAFGYKYDNLEFNGLSIPQLARELDHQKSKDRMFAGFLLHGFKKSALVEFYICKDSTCGDLAGEFYILGSEKETPWSYNRLYKYEITDTMSKLGLRHTDRLSISYNVIDLSGQNLGSDLFGIATVLREPGSGGDDTDVYVEALSAASHVRKNLEDLTQGEVESLRAAFNQLADEGKYEEIAKFHGAPGLCELHKKKIACCHHGMATFPHWHRLYIVQVENALLQKGSAIAVPYWDWTLPIKKLPSLIAEATYYNSRQQRFDPNPFFRGSVSFENAVTSRDIQPQLFNSNYMYENALLALEQDNFCDFEIQFEILHNALHSWVGGRSKYSLSSLEYTAFDPLFFLHHSNTDRLWAVWQELQRYRHKAYNTANCAINLMSIPLQPFGNDNINDDHVTHQNSRPADTYDYQNRFHYKYDTLEFHHMSIPQLDQLLQLRKSNDRTYAGFLLHNINTSADVEIYICVPTGRGGEQNCNNPAGRFSLLGGPLEMPFAYDRLYKYDITHSLMMLGVMLDSESYGLKIIIRSVDGKLLDNDVLPKPTIIFEPGIYSRQQPDGKTQPYIVRKNINSLSPIETLSLVKALKSMQADSSADGYQAIAAFHALPPLCPSPSSARKHACCLHGMATFPQWHRLYTVQFEDALRKHGSMIGVPYWDWLRPARALPALLTMPTIHDPVSNIDFPNPLVKAQIKFENTTTERDIIRSKLFSRPSYKNWFVQQALLALEQENYCDFEIQFEILHNGVHTWIGGRKVYSLSHLHYASYDPAFYIHHAETDRLWAIWQKLQKFRGQDGSESNCAMDLMKVPLKPFSFGSPYNLNKKTTEYSKPSDTFAYKERYGYIYDSLDFMGLDIERLDSFIKEKQEDDRIFAGFLLKGFGSSASVLFQICKPDEGCREGGYFTILGGSAEMPWAFDRLYKYDITSVLKEADLHYEDPFTIKVQVTALNGTALGSLIPTPSVIFVAGTKNSYTWKHSPNSIRKEVSTLSERDIQSLMSALRNLQQDKGPDGFGTIASFHGMPLLCPDPNNPSIACCHHGMATFPHWHRLYIVHFEEALRRHGSSVAVPYWDWTKPITALPKLFTNPRYYDAWRDEVFTNPFARGYIPSESTHTVRDVQNMLFELSTDRKHSILYDYALLALEQEDFCDFEVQFEVLHNWIHYLVGGRQTYALSSLHWTSYDPLFFSHHSFVDKLWALWQELQKRRNKPYDRAECALNLMSTPMKPFNFDLNTNTHTKAHAVPNTLFDYTDLGYSYDDLNLAGHSIEDIEASIKTNTQINRVFAGFLLHGIGTSADVKFEICKTVVDCYKGGLIYILGGSKEMPWAFDRLFKLDITQALVDAGIEPEGVHDAKEPFFLKVMVTSVNGKRMPPSTLPAPTIIYKPAAGKSRIPKALNRRNNCISNNCHENGLMTLPPPPLPPPSLPPSLDSGVPLPPQPPKPPPQLPPSLDYREPLSTNSRSTFEGSDASEAYIHHSSVSIRKNVNDLTLSEVKSLRIAMAAVQSDSGPNGFQAIASYHGSPPMCKMADGKNRSCCHHGMATFPHWHRLYVKQMEDALVANGATTGIPYWEWTEAFTSMPTFATATHNNPWNKAKIAYLGKVTTRSPRPQLFSDPEKGEESFFYRQVLLALEQTDYCTFEVQFEMVHNAIHSWTGGHSQYGMSTLDFTSYDPLFYLHHSNVDRLWAIWQALQRYRGLPYNKAYCDIQDLKEPMRPFSDPINPNPVTRANSRPFDVFDYGRLNYQYDNLKFHGMTIPELNSLLGDQGKEDRMFVSFLLSGIKKSVDVEFDICIYGGMVCRFAGTFAILGGPHEMDWAFDRLFRYDVTKVMKVMGLRYDADLDLRVRVIGIDGNHLDSSVITPPTLEFVPGTADKNKVKQSTGSEYPSDKLIRKEINTLSLDEANMIKNALYKLQNDNGNNGYEAIASFHGAPYTCPETGDGKFACCAHGMAIFPHWHRLHTIQFERALVEKGSTLGVPYWDWTKPIKSIPSFFSDSSNNNPFYKYHIKFAHHDTQREISPLFFDQPKIDDYNYLYYMALNALEEDNFCDFEVQYEIVHNAVHSWIGGTKNYSMSTLEYAAFDPVFMIHHSSIDRIWIIWQELQKLRKKPFSSAKCAGNMMNQALYPFSYESVNADAYTKKFSDPKITFDQARFSYWYDTVNLNDQTLDEVYEVLQYQRHRDRIFAGFVLSGIQATASVKIILICPSGKEEVAGTFIILGGEREMPWAYERLYKYDITTVAAKLGLNARSTFNFRLEITKYDGTSMDVTFPTPLILHRPAHVQKDVLIVPIGSDIQLPPKVVVKQGTEVVFHAVDSSVNRAMISLNSYTAYFSCVVPPFAFNNFELETVYSLKVGQYFFTAPTKELCQKNIRIQITVDGD